MRGATVGRSLTFAALCRGILIIGRAPDWMAVQLPADYPAASKKCGPLLIEGATASVLILRLED